MSAKISYDLSWLLMIAMIAYLVYKEQTAWALTGLALSAIAIGLHIAALIIRWRKK